MNNSTSRRWFLGGVSGAIALLGGSLANRLEVSAQPQKNSQNSQTIKPPLLKPGDTVGMVAPASNAYELEEIRIAKETMEQYGFKVELGKHINAQYGYLAGKDKERAEDLNEMFRRPDIRGIVTFSGGYGCSRLLPLLDYDSIRKILRS